MSIKWPSAVLSIFLAVSAVTFAIIVHTKVYPALAQSSEPNAQSSETMGTAGSCFGGLGWVGYGGICSEKFQTSTCSYKQKFCEEHDNRGVCGTEQIRSEPDGTTCAPASACKERSTCQGGECRDGAKITCAEKNIVDGDVYCERWACSEPTGCARVEYQPPVDARCSMTTAPDPPICGQPYWERYTTLSPAKCGGRKCPTDRQLMGPVCPKVDCKVGDWMDPPNKPTCGTYTQTRAVIEPAAYGGQECPELTRTVDLGSCAVNCEVSGWISPDTIPECGSYTLMRTITKPPQNGGLPCPSLTQEVTLDPCPVDCLLSDWQAPAIKPTCGSYQEQRQVLRAAENGGAPCGATSRTVTLAPCPKCDCMYEVPSVLAGSSDLEPTCSHLCVRSGASRGVATWMRGAGGVAEATCICITMSQAPCPLSVSSSSTFRTTTYNQPIQGAAFIGVYASPDVCKPSDAPPPIDCVMSPWLYPSPLPPCGYVTRTRTIISPPSNGGAICGPTWEAFLVGTCEPTQVTCFGSIHQRPYNSDNPKLSATCRRNSDGVDVTASMQSLGAFASGPERLAAPGNYDVAFAQDPVADGFEVKTVPGKIEVLATKGTCSISPKALAFGSPISESALNASGAGTFTYKYKTAGSTDTFASLAVDGSVKLKAGTYTIQATLTPTDPNITPTTCDGSLTVTKITPTCSWAQIPDLKYGVPLSASHLNARVLGLDNRELTNGVGTYSTSIGTVLPVSTTGHPITYTWTPSQADAVNYNGVSCSNSVKVTAGEGTCTIAPRGIVFGTAITREILNASGEGEITFKYQLFGPPTTRNELKADGTVRLPAGTYTVEATVTPTNSNIAPSSCTASLYVGKATPTCSWASPLSEITSGTPLSSSTHLNARVLGVGDVVLTGGTATYSPPSGTTLGVAGSPHTITYEWKPSPDDSVNYSGVTCTNTIRVTEKPLQATYCTVSANSVTYGTGVTFTATGYDSSTRRSIGGEWKYNVGGTEVTSGVKLAAKKGYSVTATFIPADKSYSSSNCSGSFDVSAATVKIQVNNATIQFGQDIPTFTKNDFTVDPLVAPDTKDSLFGTNVPTTVATKGDLPKTPGYPITIAAPTNSNYTFEVVNGTLTVNQVATKCQVLDQTVQAGTAVVFGAKAYAGTTLLTGGTFTYKEGTTTFADGKSDFSVGEHLIVARYTPPNAGYLPSECSALIEITAKPLQATYCTVSANSVTYGTGVTFTATGYDSSTRRSIGGEWKYNVGGTEVTSGVKLAAKKGHSVTATFIPADKSYSSSTCSGSFDVSAATVKIQVNNATIQFGQDIPTFTKNDFTVDPLVAPDTKDSLFGTNVPTTIAKKGDLPKTPGYPITIAAPTNSNYTFEVVNGNLTISKVTPTCSWGAISDISYQTTLSSTQLNAKVIGVGGADITGSGTGTYSPASGALLAATDHSISYTWVPSASVSGAYNSVTCANKVTVTTARATCTISPKVITYGDTVSLDTLNAKGDGTFTFRYKPLQPATAAWSTLNTNSSVAPSAGTYTVEATIKASDPNLTSGTCEGTLTVNKMTPQCIWTQVAGVNNITFGAALSSTHLNAKISGLYGADLTGSGTGTYSPAAGAKLAVGTHPLSFSWIPSASVGSNYNSVACSGSVKVTEGASTCSISPKAVTVGTALTAEILNAQGDGTFTYRYRPVSGTDKDWGTLNLGAKPPAGDYTVEATFKPTDTNLLTSKCLGRLLITKVTPTCQWGTIRDISYGTKLSSTQLNAKILGIGGADITARGVGTYSPALDATLSATSHPLSYSWKPTYDTDTYEPVTCTNSINVTTAAATCSIKPSSISYPTPLTEQLLGAWGSGTFTYRYKLTSPTSDWKSLDPKVGPVIDAGTYTVEATLKPSDGNLTTTTCTGTLEVKKVRPTCKWDAIADVAPNTTLSGTQLNAKILGVGGADITASGTGSYSPASGTVIARGSTSLTYSWTSASVNYESTTCANTVKTPLDWCGDGYRTGDEECDGKDSSLLYGIQETTRYKNGFESCSTSCKRQYCGDGIKNNLQEECDGGASCSADCKLLSSAPPPPVCTITSCPSGQTLDKSVSPCKCVPNCGNGKFDPGEECDASAGVAGNCQGYGCVNCQLDYNAQCASLFTETCNGVGSSLSIAWGPNLEYQSGTSIYRCHSDSTCCPPASPPSNSANKSSATYCKTAPNGTYLHTYDISSMCPHSGHVKPPSYNISCTCNQTRGPDKRCVSALDGYTDMKEYLREASRVGGDTPQLEPGLPSYSAN